MSSTTAAASASPPMPAADDASADTMNSPATSCHTNPMAQVQNTGFHRSRTVAAASAFVMRGDGSGAMISRRLNFSDAAAATGSTAIVHAACAISGSACSATLSATDRTADRGM